MAGDPAELAYGHALAMLGDPTVATDVAVIALKRAGRARNLVLAHARERAVARAAADEPVDVESLHTVVLDLPALAATLASTRAPEERAALDLRTRTGGDLAALGEALGVRPSEAADKTAAIAEDWERVLDPALLAFSGPGDCEDLAAILDGAQPDTVAKLLSLAPAVHAHTEDCTTCTDRVRAMASVRSFFSDAAVNVPDAVRVASHLNRTKRPSAPPLPLFPETNGTPRQRRLFTPLRVAASLVVLLAAGVGVGAVSRDDVENARPLTRVAAANGLGIDATITDGFASNLVLRNRTQRPVAYTLSSPAEWLRLEPTRGRLDAGATVPIIATLTDDAPEGAATATIVVHTASGATASRQFTWRVERAPELATTIDGCAVGVSVVDDGDLATLVLHWRDVVEHALDIREDGEGYSAELRPDNGPVTYWVTASDSRGNQSRTAEEVIAPGAC